MSKLIDFWIETDRFEVHFESDEIMILPNLRAKERNKWRMRYL